ncbi:microtubule associated protein 6 [Pitangus sulphuratus]|nr:microtubule associated protein 6 [Pitangus sulphuratus]
MGSGIILVLRRAGERLVLKVAVVVPPSVAITDQSPEDTHLGGSGVQQMWLLQEAGRNEFRPWIDVKPVKAIRAKPQYKPPEEKMIHETSYSAQFKGETSKPSPADNKYLERRRIRTLYSEPYKEPPKVEKPSIKPSKPKKTTTSHKPLKKAKDKQIASGRAAKKKSAETSNTAKPEDKEKSKEMNNKLAEAKE